MTSRSSASAPSGFSKLPLIDTNKRCTGSGFSPTASMSRPLGAISRVLHAARKWLYEHDVAAEWELLTNELESGARTRGQVMLQFSEKCGEGGLANKRVCFPPSSDEASMRDYITGLARRACGS